MKKTILATAVLLAFSVGAQAIANEIENFSTTQAVAGTGDMGGYLGHDITTDETYTGQFYKVDIDATSLQIKNSQTQKVYGTRLIYGANVTISADEVVINSKNSTGPKKNNRHSYGLHIQDESSLKFTGQSVDISTNNVGYTANGVNVLAGSTLEFSNSGDLNIEALSDYGANGLVSSGTVIVKNQGDVNISGNVTASDSNEAGVGKSNILGVRALSGGSIDVTNAGDFNINLGGAAPSGTYGVHVASDSAVSLSSDSVNIDIDAPVDGCDFKASGIYVSSADSTFEVKQGATTISIASGFGTAYGVETSANSTVKFNDNLDVTVEGPSGEKVQALYAKTGSTIELLGEDNHLVGDVSILSGSGLILNQGTTTLDGNLKVEEATDGNEASYVKFVNDGALKLAEGSEAQIASVEGEGTLIVQDAATAITIADNQSEALTIEVAAGVNFEDLTNIKVENGSDTVSLISYEAGEYRGEITASLGSNGTIDVDSIKAQANSVMVNTLDLVSASTLSMNRVMMNDVRKRMGDLRSAEGTHGVWARYDGGKLSGDANLENDFTTVQVGIDTVPVADAPRFGVAFAYTQSDADLNRGSAEMDAFSLAFYGTKMYDNGMFVDVIGRMATADTDVTIDGVKKGSMDNVALSLSGELGWRYEVTDKFYFEPQAELTYTYVNADALALNNGSTLEFDSVDSLIGRVGFATGYKCPNGMGDVYVRASAVHEFLGDATVRGGTYSHEVDGEDTWVEFGIGANFNLNKNTYIYADIERTEGAKLEEDWRANVGVRYAF